jgi:hypothetical protein
MPILISCRGSNGSLKTHRALADQPRGRLVDALDGLTEEEIKIVESV